MTNLVISPEVQAAIDSNQPIVALESTVISHGLPYPANIELAQEVEQIVRDHGAVPATIAIIEGVPTVGITHDQLMQLVDENIEVMKISRRDFGIALAQKSYGATTVAATMILAHKAGVKVFATGGIGGVHRGDDYDISADLIELGQTPVAVVCAGAKSILDLPKTLEYLETYGVPVLGLGTDKFPAFYTDDSGLDIHQRVDDIDDLAGIINAHWGFGLKNGVLVTVPIPKAEAMNPAYMDKSIQQALSEADQQKISGKDTTPFLLQRLVEITEGESLTANLALLRNNAKVAAQIAVSMQKQNG